MEDPHAQQPELKPEPKPRKSPVQKFVNGIRKLPDKKHYVEFFTAILTVPVLLTVIILNVSNLKGNESNKDKDATPTIVVKEVPVNTKTSPVEHEPTQAPPEQCREEIGPISITNPEDGETVTDNPMSFTISYPDRRYCAVVWSYRVNGGRWSEYDDKSVALYNLPAGNVNFELRVKSVVTGEEKRLTRTVNYQPSVTAAPTTTPTTTP